MSTKLKYIDSHWGIFVLQGIVALLFGWFALFTSSSDVQTLVIIVGSVLLSLGIIELLNLLARTRAKNTWGVALFMAILEVTAGLSLLFTYEQNVAWHLIVIASYTIIRGIFEIILGLKAIDDLTDKFIWILTGVCACIMGAVIFNTGHLGNTPFIKYFGSYMMVFGVVNLIYAIHNKEQAKDYRLEKIATKKQTTKNLVNPKNTEVKAKTKSVKKTSVKNSKKSAK